MMFRRGGGVARATTYIADVIAIDAALSSRRMTLSQDLRSSCLQRGLRYIYMKKCCAFRNVYAQHLSVGTFLHRGEVRAVHSLSSYERESMHAAKRLQPLPHLYPTPSQLKHYNPTVVTLPCGYNGPTLAMLLNLPSLQTRFPT